MRISCSRSVLALHLKRFFDNAGLPRTKPRDSALRAVTKVSVLLTHLVVGVGFCSTRRLFTRSAALAAQRRATLANEAVTDGHTQAERMSEITLAHPNPCERLRSVPGSRADEFHLLAF